MLEAAMTPIGHDANRRPLYWAEPGQFTNPGVYVWTGSENERIYPVHPLAAVDAEVHDPKNGALPVAGYKPQTQAKVDRVNGFKQDEERILRKLDALRSDFRPDPETGVANVDINWLFEGRRYIELGFMMVNRSIFQPGRAELPEDHEVD